jgi:hypothetical protein
MTLEEKLLHAAIAWNATAYEALTRKINAATQRERIDAHIEHCIAMQALRSVEAEFDKLK